MKITPNITPSKKSKPIVQGKHSPNFFIQYLTQNVIYHVKSHVTKHES